MPRLPRRLLPHLAALLATLLLVQWGQGAAACLSMLRLEPTNLICHASPDPLDPGTPTGTMDHAGLACPHCAPLPPAISANPPTIPLSQAPVLQLLAGLLPDPPAPSPPRTAAHQPRAPPLQA